MFSLRKNWAPALLILLIAITKLLALVFLIGMLMGEMGSSLSLTQRLNPRAAAGLGMGFAILSIAGWISLWYYNKKKKEGDSGPLEKIERIGE
jgi:hypothetical protein